MSGHTRWSPLDRENAYIDEMELQKVAGYILALEDVLRDLSVMSYDRYTLDQVQLKVEQSLGEAQRTLAYVREKLDHG